MLKLKYVRIDEEWGSGEKGEDASPFLYSGLEGVTTRGGGNKKISKKALALEGAALITRNKITAWTQKVGISSSSKKCMKRKVCIGVNGVNDLLAIEWNGLLAIEWNSLLAIEWEGGSSECATTNSLTDTTSARTTTTIKLQLTKSKVWTKLKNGLFGWRKVGVGKRRYKSDLVKQGPPSVSSEKWEPVELGSSLNITPDLRRKKRKYSKGGGMNLSRN